MGQSDGTMLDIPQFVPSVYKSTRQGGFSFAYDAPEIWNDLPPQDSWALFLLIMLLKSGMTSVIMSDRPTWLWNRSMISWFMLLDFAP